MGRAQFTSAAQRALAPRCAVCGRPLSRSGYAVPGIGVVGPECRRKYAAMEAYLEAAHPRLVNAVYGGANLAWDELTPEERYRLHGAILALRQAGLRVEVIRDERARTVHVRVAGVERPRAWAGAWKRDVWRAWGERLRLQAEARALAAEMGAAHD
ncbi:hypothetical protein QT17_01780 [Thermus sp. 2.9]|uniref:hypothetical protein n=1 Tax=unclassified Thermus TaxID=2619321 RepID=UPI000542D620|nr:MULTISPECIES: hypothetical protein [unclassified Thermus]KHG66069.1 hypothetical protein QT17_01780 [Thermus sp. 2.9]